MPSIAFHAVANAKQRLSLAGFKELKVRYSNYVQAVFERRLLIFFFRNVMIGPRPCG